MSLRFFNIKWKDVDEYLKSIGFMTAKTCHAWVTVFIKGDYEEFSNDLRSGKQTLIISERSCRVDLCRWGTTFEANS